MSYATIDALRESLAKPAAKPTPSPEYVAKMLHDVPESTVVDRAVFILQRVAGKRVLEFGASGPMHDGIVKAAHCVLGVDRVAAAGVEGFDLDEISPTPGDDIGPDLPWRAGLEIIVCGEVLEHLTNPGWFLARLKRQYAGVPVVITVPNAFSAAASRHIAEGVENVNIDHVAWYSYRTLRTLLERYGFAIDACHWYGGQPFTAEGLIVVAHG